MHAPHALAPLLAALLLSGCLSAAPDADGPDDLHAAPGAPTEAQPALNAPPGATSTDSTVAFTGAAFSWDGSTRAGYCAPEPSGGCSGRSVSLGETLWRTDARPGDEAWVEVEVTWDHRIPGLDDLRVTFYALRPCGDGCTASRMLDTVQGETPLAISTGAYVLEDGEDGFGVRVSDARPVTTDPAHVDAEHPRSFHAEGVLWRR